MIPYGRQDISQDDIDAVCEILQSDFLTQGPKVPEFEDAISLKVGAKHAIAVNSATSALHVSCLALGLGQNDILWTSPITFVASANCALYCGAKVDFVDIDPETYNLSIEQLELKLEKAEKLNLLPKILVAVHLCGQSCDMEKIWKLSERYGFFVIEDASHAVGGMYKNQFIGSCRYSHITVFSFHPVKIITTAEGGVAVTNDLALAKKIALFRSHGITRDRREMVNPPAGPWYYEQITLGFNYRMTELQAALGISQLARLDEFVARRNLLADRYDSLLSDLPIKLPRQNVDSYSSRHLYVIRLPFKSLETHRLFFELMRNNGVGVNLHYIPVHLQPYYRDMGFERGHYPEAEKYYAEALSLPLYSSMTYSQQDEVVNVIKLTLKTLSIEND